MQTITDGTTKFAIRDKRMQAMIDLFYPVGSVYITADPEMEKEDFPFMQYGTWEELPRGVCLQTVIDGKQVGTEVDAGLPNITGSFKSFSVLNHKNEIEGAFYNPDTTTGAWGGNTNNVANYRIRLSFDASKSNAIYGNSDTVQPPAYMVKAWRRME